MRFLYRSLFLAAVCALLPVFPIPKKASADDTATSIPAPYATFVSGAAIQPGLLPIITKNGNVYLALKPSQLGADFIETSVPSSGLGGFGPAAGETHLAPARILHFDRVGDKVVLRWPNTIAQVNPSTPQALAARQSFPSSIIAVVTIAAVDSSNGTIVIPASSFLQDIGNYSAAFSKKIDNPVHGYELDEKRTFFTQEKALPDNDILHVSQTWAASDPNLIDNVPDPRSIEIDMTYNIIAAPTDNYMPRIADPRVGYLEQPLLDFAHDPATRNIYYILRWNFAPEHPGRPSNATHPMVFFLSNDIPLQYRSAVREALLTWNKAFVEIGILNAIQVEQQPDDPNWDPDDIRHNMVRWVDTSTPIFGAEALQIADPRTGEELNVGIGIDAVEGTAKQDYRYLIAPARGLPDTAAGEDAYEQTLVRGAVLHESGHDFGLQHNFMASLAYTAKDLQSKAFTDKYGTAASVMAYTPINIWPKNTPQGAYAQVVLGPYDYHAIKYGYAYIPGASTPEQELPVLRSWASNWNNPLYRFASDEDVHFSQGHAIDPRVQTFTLTNDPLAWCGVQIQMEHHLVDAIDTRFPQPDDARRAFLRETIRYVSCAKMPANTIGGEYLSRAQAGDPDAGPPLQAVPRSEELRAWHLLATWLFSDSAWHFNPNVLDRLTYSEASLSLPSGTWAYSPSPRHDIAVSQIAITAQEDALNEIFAPLTLERIDDLSSKYRRGKTMSLLDLFDWSAASIFGDIASGGVAKDGVVRRDLQIRFAERLAKMWVSPEAGTPTDAQALARFTLSNMQTAASAALARKNIDEMTRAHLEALVAIAKQALEIKGD